MPQSMQINRSVVLASRPDWPPRLPTSGSKNRRFPALTLLDRVQCPPNALCGPRMTGIRPMASMTPYVRLVPTKVTGSYSIPFHQCENTCRGSFRLTGSPMRGVSSR